MKMPVLFMTMLRPVSFTVNCAQSCRAKCFFSIVNGRLGGSFVPLSSLERSKDVGSCRSFCPRRSNGRRDDRGLKIREATVRCRANYQAREEGSSCCNGVANGGQSRDTHLGAGYGDRAGCGWQQGPMEGTPGRTRRMWTSTPLQMGRRSAKIATKKGAQDKKKAKLYGKIGKQIVGAVKGGGPNPVSNVALATILQTAKDYNVPKDIVDRNIKRASDKNQQDFEELTYEVYGFGGVGIVLEVLTDNNNRAAANIRDIVKKSGGKMAEKGSVMFNFKRTGVILVKPSANITTDDILLAAMDAGAEDLIDLADYEDEDSDHSSEEQYLKVLTPVEQFGAISRKLQETGILVDIDNSGLELFPVAPTKPDDEANELNRIMMEKLLDLEDVDAVSSTQY